MPFGKYRFRDYLFRGAVTSIAPAQTAQHNLWRQKRAFNWLIHKLVVSGRTRRDLLPWRLVLKQIGRSPYLRRAAVFFFPRVVFQLFLFQFFWKIVLAVDFGAARRGTFAGWPVRGQNIMGFGASRRSRRLRQRELGVGEGSWRVSTARAVP